MNLCRTRLLSVLLVSAAAMLGCSGPLPSGDSVVGQGPPSSIFTPAHRTLLAALRDYFDRRPLPVQPIAYTHKVHLANGLQCTNCHVGVDTGPDARIPNIKICMTCHQIIDKDKPEIQKMAAIFARGEDISWQRVYNYVPAAHVRFNHAPHIRAGVDCKVCHGDMTQQTVAVRVVNLQMGFCLDCHKQRRVSVDCTTCHY
jgi:Cytochrome c7 and related cytochrome c/Class III cytochrome C family